MVLGNNEIQFIQREDIGTSSLFGPIIFSDKFMLINELLQNNKPQWKG